MCDSFSQAFLVNARKTEVNKNRIGFCVWRIKRIPNASCFSIQKSNNTKNEWNSNRNTGRERKSALIIILFGIKSNGNNLCFWWSSKCQTKCDIITACDGKHKLFFSPRYSIDFEHIYLSPCISLKYRSEKLLAKKIHVILWINANSCEWIETTESVLNRNSFFIYHVRSNFNKIRMMK